MKSPLICDRTLVLKLFEGFSIERWNDLARPFELIEMDKAAEKAVLAYMIGKMEESRGASIDWSFVAHGILFDLLRKIALCDIKAPVQRMIRSDFPEEYRRLNEWVVDQYRAVIRDGELLGSFERYVNDEPDRAGVSWRVLRAAHKFSTLRELEMVRAVNEPFRLVEIEKALARDLEDFADLACIRELAAKGKAWLFLTEIEKLRFQTRWNQTPRVPRTSVLGHSFFVAALTILLGRGRGISPRREYANFFSALFHDLPEAVTRDIISPVKQATSGLPAIVKEIEDRIVARELVPLMDEAFRNELVYFTTAEFENRVRAADGVVRVMGYGDLAALADEAASMPVEGKLVRVADHVAALVEADSSIAYGITSAHLRDGRRNILSLYPADKVVNGVPVGALFAEFASSLA